jgi:PiT family inorganic phosphate transporter
MRASAPGQSALLMADVAESLAGQGVRYAVICAMAAVVHGVVRASLDADAIVMRPLIRRQSEGLGNRPKSLKILFSIPLALSAAVVVIIASWLGLPVSSTHIAIGGIFGVGFYREWYHEQVLKENRDMSALPVEERIRRKVVRRSHLLAILAAWVITVPATALLSAGLFLVLARIGGAG